jgi:co-chaperonin GroES (HSP10)
LSIDLASIPAGAWVEIPGMRGLSVARMAQSDGTTVEVLSAVKGVVIPAMETPSSERGKVIAGSLRYMRDGEVLDLKAGDGWEIGANQSHGPHVVLEDGTRIAILRNGRGAFDPA